MPENLNCPYGAYTRIVVETREDGLFGQCALAAAALDQRGWLDPQVGALKWHGCPEPRGADNVLLPARCRYSSGRGEKIVR